MDFFSKAGAAALLVLVSISGTVWAQVPACDPSALPGQAGSCGSLGFPNCYVCLAVVGGPNACVPDDGRCDDGNACTEDICAPDAFPDPANIGAGGCENPSRAMLGEADLPPDCFVCEPAANRVAADNGICEQDAGENCVNAPADCLEPGEACVFPSQPTPFPTCDGAVEPVPWGSCSDGDRCTDDLCAPVVGTPSFVCQNPQIAECRPVSDGCCPAGCEGSASETCATDGSDPFCDPDCCPTASCGDLRVEFPETCDDNPVTGEAGLRPDGAPVTNTDCRDAGAAGACSYCGDNIVQPEAGESCDGTAPNACETGCGGDCVCLPASRILCLEGSGLHGDGGSADCKGFSCGLARADGPVGSGGAMSLGWMMGALGGFLFLRGLRAGTPDTQSANLTRGPARTP